MSTARTTDRRALDDEGFWHHYVINCVHRA